MWTWLAKVTFTHKEFVTLKALKSIRKLSDISDCLYEYGDFIHSAAIDEQIERLLDILG